jgi:hypothetical protein
VRAALLEQRVKHLSHGDQTSGRRVDQLGVHPVRGRQTVDWASITRTSTEPSAGCSRTSHQKKLGSETAKTEIAAITKSVVTASKSSSPQAALKSAEPEIKAALTKLSDNYKKAFEALKCS